MPNRKTARAVAPNTLLVEVLTEELPPRALARLSHAFRDALFEDLRQDNLLTQTSQAKAYASPRRLAVSISGVLAKAPDAAIEITGPSVKVGLDAEGKPTPALAGFARKCGVAVDALVQVDSAKGSVFACRKLAAGANLDTNLGLKVGFALEKLPAPKTMRWGNGDSKFVRPVHGLVMMHGARVVRGEVMDVRSSNRTLGHRVLSRAPVRLRHADDYERALRVQGKVIADFAARRTEIARQLEKAAGRTAALVMGDALLDEITALVEAPAAYSGRFSPEFLEVPQECLILSMQQHQRYIPLRDKTDGTLLPRFLFVSNLPTGSPRAIIHGNERVLRARLSDAKFFYDQDRKSRLETRVARLADVVYHNKLGSQLERAERIQLLAGGIARGIGADFLLAERAAKLSKADLLTEMVGEFPELQGIMGRYYALHDGEPEEVAAAIAEHYRPRYAGDKLPEGNVAIAVALADKLDALAGLFNIGQQPTGDRDPFGLRRAALGIVRILVEKQVSLSLTDLADAAFKPFANQAQTELRVFFIERMRSYFQERSYTANEVEAVLSKNPVEISPIPKQLEAVRAFSALPEAASLAAANKRIANILRQAESSGQALLGDADVSVLKEPEEIALFEALKGAIQSAKPLFDARDFSGYLKTFAALKGPVDSFFDKVMVMVDDQTLRKNRLALLSDLQYAMNRFADISKLAA